MITDLQIEHIQSWHSDNKKVVLVTGVFDLLHHAHRTFLRLAKEHGDVLIVGLESDVRVKKIKGFGRPINTAEVRKSSLEKEQIANLVFILPEQFDSREDYLTLLQIIKPAVLAVSSHTKHLDAKKELMQLVGGEVIVVMEHDPTISTTQLLNGLTAK